MYYIHINDKIEKKIHFKKIGITIRPLNNKEKNALNKYIDYILGYKKNIYTLVKKYNFNDTEYDQILELSKSKKIDPNGIIMMGYLALKDGFVFNNKRTIKNTIDHLIAIDVDKKITKKYIEDKYINKFVSNFLNLSNIYNKKIDKAEMIYNKDYTYLLENNIFKDNKEYFHQILLSLIMSYQKNNSKPLIVRDVDLSKNFLMQFIEFEKKLDNFDIIRFFEILDIFNSNPSMIQNAILNNVLIVESLLMNDKSNIQKEYVLKGGIILKKSLNSKNKKACDNLKYFLSFVYNIRSDIIHGNNKKIEEDLNTLNNKNKNINKIFGETKNYKDTKNKAFKIAYTISLFVTLSVIKYWIKNPTEIYYLKIN